MRNKRYVFYFLLVTITSAFLFKISVTSSAGCDAWGGKAGSFMAYCDISTHGHYDHAAYLFNLEEGLANRVRQANLLFLGSSRTQFAFSTTSLTNFVISHPAVRPYLLGFGYGEQSAFSAAVLERIKPTPALVVINADPFFTDVPSPHARQLLNNMGLEENNARIKKLWHQISEASCDGNLPIFGNLICGSHPTVYRSVQDGRWILHNENLASTPVSNLPQTANDDADIVAFTRNAEAFISKLHLDRKCVVITYVPTSKGKPFIAQSIAARLGTPFVAPQLASLSTFDGSHLDTVSSERWSKAFLTELEPILDVCMH